MMNIYHLPLVATLLSGFGACYAFAPSRTSNSKPHYSVPGSTSQLFASTDDQEETKNVVIVGAGIAGLSIAHYLATSPDSNLNVTLLDCKRADMKPNKNEKLPASLAAAGFLEPKLLQSGDRKNLLNSICIESRNMYDDWLNGFGAGDQFEEQGYFIPEDQYTECNVKYPSAVTISGKEACETEKNLNSDIPSWKYLINAATVSARGLLRCLRTACENEGVETNSGDKFTVVSLTRNDNGDCTGVELKDGTELSGTVVVANGDDINVLTEGLGIAQVVKNDYKCFVLKSNESRFLRTAVLSRDAYIQPKKNGKVLVGNPRGFTDNFEDAKKVVDLDDLTEKTSFKAVRASTDDNYPILGTTKNCGNLFVAGGFDNYGFLIAPKAAELIGKLILSNGDEDGLEKEEKDFLELSNPDRVMFGSPRWWSFLP